MSAEKVGEVAGVGVRHGIDVAVDGLFGVAELDLVDCLAKTIASGCHERRVEGTADRDSHRAFGAEFLGGGTGPVEVVRRSGDHDLAGGVVVGDPGVARRLLAGDIDLVVVEAEDGGHGAVLLIGGRLHGVAAFVDELGGVGEVKHACRAQGAVLAERVAGMCGCFCAGAADGVEHDHRGHEGRQLRIAGHRQFVGIGVEQEVGDVAAGRIGCLFDELPRGVVDPGGTHARRLGPLTRVGEDDHGILPSSSRSPEGQGDTDVQTVKGCRAFHYRRVTS